MLIALLVAIILVVAFFVSRFFTPIPLLEAIITTNDGSTFHVEYKLCRQEVKEVEWVWLCLLFPTKMLFNLGKESRNAIERERFIGILACLTTADWSTGADVLYATCNTITLDKTGLSGKEIKAVVGYKSETVRSIVTHIPSSCFENQLTHSWIALIAFTADRIDDFHRDLLRRALIRLYVQYMQTDPASVESLVHASRKAFLEALMQINT